MHLEPTTRTRRGTRALAAAASAAALALTVTACSTGGSEPTSDEPLTIVGFLPQTGAQASAVQPLLAGVQLAIDDINAAGGVFGQDVVYEAQDSTSDNDTAAAAAETVLNSDASIVIGTYGSGMAAAVAPTITEAGIVQVSGSNTSSALTGISPLYFRTAPTDALESARIADLVAGDGHTTVGIIWQNDAWGAAFEEGMVSNFEAAGLEVLANESFNTEETDYSAQVNAVVAAEPDAVVFLSYAVYSGAMVEQLVGTNGFPSANVYFSSSTLGDYTDSVSDLSFLEGVQAFQPGADVDTQAEYEARLLEIDPELTAFAYSASTYDATIVAALAAQVAGSTDGEAIAAAMPEVSGSTGDGETCTTYADCLAILEDGGSIDYDGLTGSIEFDDNNDVGATNYLHFVYAADGTFAVVE
ncbi:branched-chain amino acid ABC transporter substrate-binding protein [Agromyces rhizosphaerae]|uniref:Branched-chain amino acid ABC transporter substrate-binding protein n=1 Tax=Agromyces rhizosphaerae TaxID=88374 RepID=A0A9W6CZK8_9MICO|nr:ABC transporter substrate-binding protein [Agromyces rhizosphaerae]GLI26768.1 branched-chain amino acid ABC transporter substrate-binding protein [Agromyces rhizosphaerae]